MRKLFSTIIGILACCAFIHAQDKDKVTGELLSMLGSSKLLIHYEYTDAPGRQPSSGTAVVQQNKYTVTEGKAVFMCNGTTKWSMFKDTREIYIENAGGDNDIFGNLAAIIQNVENLQFDGTDISFALTLPGMQGKISCKARIDRLPLDPDAKFIIEEGVLNNPTWVVTDLR